MKKIIIISAILVAVLVIGISLFVVINNTNTQNELISEAISNALFKEKDYKYVSGECKGEGHIVIGKEKNDDSLTVYALARHGDYRLQDNNFVKVSGNDAKPVIITIIKNENEYKVTNIEWPKDGDEYESSLKAMFPEKYHDRVLSISEEDKQNLKEQEMKYAQEYLDEIGREATIGEYKDFNRTYLTSLGISVEVSNKLVTRKYANYPHWIGTEERVEDGVRYIYERAYDKDKNEVIFTKYNSETKEVVEKIVVDSLTGDEK